MNARTTRQRWRRGTPIHLIRVELLPEILPAPAGATSEPAAVGKALLYGYDLKRYGSA